MFAKRPFFPPLKAPKLAMLEINAETIILLSNAYQRCVANRWRYNPSDMAIFLIDYCIEHTHALETQAGLIGRGLLMGIPEAPKAARLFGYLYLHGFAGGLYKEKIQKQFNKVLTVEQITGLQNGDIAMEDVMRERSETLTAHPSP